MATTMKSMTIRSSTLPDTFTVIIDASSRSANPLGHFECPWIAYHFGSAVELAFSLHARQVRASVSRQGGGYSLDLVSDRGIPLSRRSRNSMLSPWFWRLTYPLSGFCRSASLVC